MWRTAGSAGDVLATFPSRPGPVLPLLARGGPDDTVAIFEVSERR